MILLLLRHRLLVTAVASAMWRWAVYTDARFILAGVAVVVFVLVAAWDVATYGPPRRDRVDRVVDHQNDESPAQ